jgi:hypothetical protein
MKSEFTKFVKHGFEQATIEPSAVDLTEAQLLDLVVGKVIDNSGCHAVLRAGLQQWADLVLTKEQASLRVVSPPNGKS